MNDVPRPCDTHPDLVRFNYPLPRLKVALRQQRNIKIVAIGSSSTAGEKSNSGKIGVVPFPHRLELALHEWSRFKANDSLECRNCHSTESMDITKQGARAARVHQQLLFTGERTCIDCHKGIAHQLPNMEGVPPGWDEVKFGH